MRASKLTDTFQLRNGVEIPCIGYGTWQAPDGEKTINGVKAAIAAGYVHIDAAAAYDNEESVGIGIKESGIERSNLFVTSKLWNTERGYESTIRACEKTLKDLQVDYLDLYLIHWPAARQQFDNWEEINIQTWRAMTDLYKSGKVRAIGTSNFYPSHLRSLMKEEVQPMVAQVEFHPGHLNSAVVQYARENGMLVEAWSPLGSGRMLNDPLLMEIAGKHGKSVAQVCIRFALQSGILPLPKSVTPERIRQNAEVFDFELEEEDMMRISEMGPAGWSGLHPDKVDF